MLVFLVIASFDARKKGLQHALRDSSDRIEDGHAVPVACHIDRGPGGEPSDLPGLPSHGEFGLEILATLTLICRI